MIMFSFGKTSLLELTLHLWLPFKSSTGRSHRPGSYHSSNMLIHAETLAGGMAPLQKRVSVS